MRERSPHYVTEGRKIVVLYYIHAMDRSRCWTLCSCNTPDDARKMAKNLNESLERMIRNESV